jgi:hypothetical protein
MATEKSKQAERLATALGLTLAELRALRRQIAVAESNLGGTPKPQRLALVARRLSITPAELQTLRSALAGGSRTGSTAARVLAGHVIGLPALKQTLGAAPPKTAARPSTRTSAGGVRVGRTPKFFRDWNADTNVFVTTWGNAVHMYADCHGTRGFRHAREPDPIVYQARLRDPVCVGRRACRKCFDVWSPSTIDRLDDLLEDLHGERRPPSITARRQGTHSGSRAPASGSPSRVATTKRPAKGERDRLAAAKLGISVAELKARRRAENEANRRRKQR